MKCEEMMRVGLALGLKMGGRGDLTRRLESFMKEMEEFGVEVKVSVSIEILDKNVREVKV